MPVSQNSLCGTQEARDPVVFWVSPASQSSRPRSTVRGGISDTPSGVIHQSPPVVKWTRSEVSLGRQDRGVNSAFTGACESRQAPPRGTARCVPGDGQGRREPDSARTGGSPAFRASPCAQYRGELGQGTTAGRRGDRSRPFSPSLSLGSRDAARATGDCVKALAWHGSGRPIFAVRLQWERREHTRLTAKRVRSCAVVRDHAATAKSMRLRLSLCSFTILYPGRSR
jgi:hypothetical protein